MVTKYYYVITGEILPVKELRGLSSGQESPRSEEFNISVERASRVRSDRRLEGCYTVE